MASKPLQWSVLFDREQAECNKTSELHMDVILTAPDRDDQKRIPLHLILAVDCSGSMAGSKIASVKATILKLVEHLTENDSLGILGFSESVFDVLPTLPMTQGNKDQARTAVNGLHDMGSTNLSQAVTMASERVVTGDKGKVCRIVLLTDGLPTCGECNKERLIEMVGKMNPDVSMTTFGYGADYDAELLASMASMGKGNNFYIEKDTDCNKAFALELGGLLSLFAQDIKVTVSPSNMNIKEFMSGYKVEEQPGYRGITAGKMSFTIDDIYVGERKHAILKIEVPGASEAVCSRPSRICDIEVSYLDVETKERGKLEAKASIQYVRPGKVICEENAEVKKQLILIEAARIQREAKEKADNGDYSGAQTVLNEGLKWVGLPGVQGPLGAAGTAGVKGVFDNMLQNSADRLSYSTKGVKLASAYVTSFSTARSSSMDSVAMSYTSSMQADMLDSFENRTGTTITNTPSDASITITEPFAGSGELKITGSADVGYLNLSDELSKVSLPDKGGKKKNKK